MGVYGNNGIWFLGNVLMSQCHADVGANIAKERYG